MATNHRIRFMGNNRAELTAGTQSSEDASYPFSNTQDYQRSKYWAQTGYFNVTGSNQVIYINDGSDKSANVVIGEYTTRASLATAIQTALNGVSSNWTVSFSDTTGYFTVDRSSGTKTLRVSQTTNAIWDLIGFTGSTDITAGQADAKRYHQEEHVIWDFGAAVDCSFFAAIGTTGSDFAPSEAGTFTIEANNVNDFSSPPLSETLTRSHYGLLHFMAATDTTYRFWKFKMVDRENPSNETGLPISNFYLGDYTTMTQTNVARGFQKQIIDRSSKLTSIGGQQYYNEKDKFITFSNLSIQYLTETERYALETFFHRKGISTPFYMSMDPTLCITSEIEDLTRLVRFDTPAQLTHVFKDRYSISFTASEVI